MLTATSVMKVSSCNSLWDVCIHDMHVLLCMWNKEVGERSEGRGREGVGERERERERERGRVAGSNYMAFGDNHLANYRVITY